MSVSLLARQMSLPALMAATGVETCKDFGRWGGGSWSGKEAMCVCVDRSHAWLCVCRGWEYGSLVAVMYKCAMRVCMFAVSVMESTSSSFTTRAAYHTPHTPYLSAADQHSPQCR
jgi:hypothetical protein